MPSVTAMFVAFARAVSTYDAELRAVCRDPFAEQLLPKALGRVITSTKQSAQAAQSFRAARVLSLGLFDHLALRTTVIDEALQAAVAGGMRQVVLLGAGLDARAHRLRWLSACTVFEVDHPSTQRLKLRKAAGLPVCAREIRYAPCDFQDVTLDEALRARGFDPAQPSAFIWEGVTMYLPASAVDQSLMRLGSLSAAGSTLIATYITPQVTAQRRGLAQLGLATLQLASEPVRSTYTEGQMRTHLAQHGFAAQSDSLPFRAAARHGVRRAPLLWGVPDEHVVVALKT